MSYLLELRRRLLISGCFFILLFVAFYYISTPLLQWFVSPLQRVLPHASSMIATGVATAVLAPLHLALSAAFFCTTPFILYQFWRFVSPALYRYEQNYVLIVLCASLCLFVFGAAFCFYGVLPFMFQILTQMKPAYIQWMPDMSAVLHFILRMLTLFGLCFQLPLVCIVLVRTGTVSFSTLKMLRPYVIVLAFTVGMLLTPPDVLSQMMLAIPLWLLYELGLLCCAAARPARHPDSGAAS